MLFQRSVSSWRTLLLCGPGAPRDGNVEGGPVGYGCAIFVVDRPRLRVVVVADAYGVVVVYLPGFPWVPVLGDRDDGVRLLVNQRIIQIGGVALGVGGFGVVDEPS